MGCFALPAFKIFLVFVFQHFDPNVSRWESFLVYLINVFHQIWRIFNQYFSNIFFCLSHFLLSFWRLILSLCIFFCMLHGAPQVSEATFIFFIPFSFCFSDQINLIWRIFKLTDSLTCSNLFLSLSFNLLSVILFNSRILWLF